MAPIVTLINGDSSEVLANPAGLYSIRPTPDRLYPADAVVTDPPYGFDFAGEKDWDTFEGDRFSTSAEDTELFAQFTKTWSKAAQNLLLPGAHVLAFSADRTVDALGRGLRLSNLEIVRVVFWLYASGQVKNPNDLRPGCEPIFVGRYFGSMGDLKDLKKLFKEKGRGQLQAQTWKEEDGKHPTNVLIDDSLVQYSEEVADLVSAHPGTFFVPKPSPKDRDAYCGDLPTQKKDNRLSHMTSNYTGKVVKDVLAQNVHPTVKPIELMRRLIRLVTRPGHTVIDPFMGSGTTGVAAILEGRNFIGVEREPEYFKIAETRVRTALAEVSQ